MSSLDLGPWFAEVAFEKMLPSDLALAVDERLEGGFAVVGVHLEALVGEGALSALKKSESQTELGLMADKSVAHSARMSRVRQRERPAGQLRTRHLASVA